MSVDYKRIQQRHGTYQEVTDTNINQILADEFIIVDSGHPDTTSGSAVCYKANNELIRLQNADDPVTIGEGSVGNLELADNSVSRNKIGSGEVLTRHIGDGQVTLAKLGADVQPQVIYWISQASINGSQIINYTIGQDQLDYGIVSWDRLATSTKNEITSRMLYVPIVSNVTTDIADLDVGQLFVYDNELRRKTSDSYEDVHAKLKTIDVSLTLNLSDAYESGHNCKWWYDLGMEVSNYSNLLIYHMTDNSCSYFRLVRVWRNYVNNVYYYGSFITDEQGNLYRAFGEATTSANFSYYEP